ncbi:MAG: glutathione S-transferase family protein [Gammaproteobacteria bacterium]|nr:glutathione S-transferase family protein [Gammaproteobacteria bacterium]
MIIYGDKRSGNCLKVKWTAQVLGIAYEWRDIDIMAGGSRTDEYLAINPQGQVPCVRLEDGRYLAQSNAIMRYLADGSALLPSTPYERAKVDEWMFWEQYSHEPYIAVCRFHMLYLGRSADEREDWRVERGENALDFMDKMLAGRQWLVGEAMSIADIALYAYTRDVHLGGFNLASRGHVRRWLDECKEQLPPG